VVCVVCVQCVSDLRPRLAAHAALERYVQRVGDSHFSAAPPPPPVTERTEERSAQVRPACLTRTLRLTLTVAAVGAGGGLLG